MRRRLLILALLALPLLVPNSPTLLARAPLFEILVWVDGQWTVLDDEGHVLRTLAIPPNEAPSFLSLSDDGTKLLFLVRNWQTWEHDFITGATRFLFQADWNPNSQWLPGSNRHLTFSNASGNIFLYDTDAGTTTLWQSNDVVGGRAYGRLAFDGAMNIALVNIHYPGAGGMGVFEADVCNQDSNHALCNVRPLAWPGGGSSSWSDVASGSVVTADGSKVVYFERRQSVNGRVYLHDRITGGRTSLLQWRVSPEVGANVYGLVEDRYFVVHGPSQSQPGDSALFKCDIVEASCREIAIRTGQWAFGALVISAHMGGDRTAPAITVPSDLEVEATSVAGAAVEFAVTASDDIDGSVPVACLPESGSTFPLGSTTVQCSASDRAGNEAHRSFEIRVVDTTPPTIRTATPSQEMLWPPNGKMVTLDVAVEAADAVGVALCSIQSVTGSDTATADDWMLSPEPLKVALRATRLGRDGRTYVLTVNCADATGNATGTSVTVKVPHDQRGSGR